MAEYNIGDKYELEVMGICSNTQGYDYLECLGPDDRLCKVYEILKCQYTSLPNTIYGQVKSLTKEGHPLFKQDLPRVLQEHYSLGHYYVFSIADRKTDANTKANYFVIEDDFASHRWYVDDEFQIGDELVLEAKSITNKGFIRFEKHVQNEPDFKISVPCPTTDETISVANAKKSILDGDRENNKTEYKTSIVFVPGKNHEANIDMQMFNIVRELAAFMNAQGGTLYIGIHDKTHEIVGFEEDYEHLNEGEDIYKDSYSHDKDGYELKIRNTLVNLCSGYAGGLIKVGFPQQDGLTYCRVDVKQAKRPVWVKGNMMFVRQGNQARLLRGEEITFFVCERVGRDIMSIAGQEQNPHLSDDELKSLIHGAVKKAINERRATVAAQLSPEPSEIKYWVVWHKDGMWQRLKQQSQSPDVFKQIPVTEDSSDLVVVFCHKSGTVNIVKMNEFKKGANLNKEMRNGFNPNETPMEIFITHQSNMLAIYSADSGGSEYIKIHSLTDAGTTKSARNQGSYVIPTNTGHVLQYKLISATYKEKLRELVSSKREKTTSMGLDINNLNITEELNLLSTL